MNQAVYDAIWHVRARLLLEVAIEELDNGADAIPTVTAALEVLRIDSGEVDASTMDDYPFPNESDNDECTCSPEQRARGGFTSHCPVHGRWPHT